jgi:hypothetical protein
MKCKKCYQLEDVIKELFWMARRYAHGRHTYAPSIIRDVAEKMKRICPEFKIEKDETLEKPSDSNLLHYKDDYLDDI